MANEPEVLTCSECSLSPWKNHCCTCEPCVQKRIDRARDPLQKRLNGIAKLRLSGRISCQDVDATNELEKLLHGDL